MSLLLSKVRSVEENLNDIQVSCSQLNIICLTGTHIDSLVPDTMLFDAADKPVFRVHSYFYVGGVLIACDYGLRCRQLDWGLQTFPVEVIAVEISGLKSRDLLVHCIYIPPSLVKDSPQPLSNVLEFVERYKATTLLMDDLNFPDIV